MFKRAAVDVRGIVQGVGFRPYVYKQAVLLGLSGWVQNNAQGVSMEIQGEEKIIEGFVSDLQEGGPALARVESLQLSFIPVRGETGFRIVESKGGRAATLVSPDMAICPDCRSELFNTKDRRYRYPFINCTNCGPRFTIIQKLPYDRPFTTMGEFPMCPDCASEYKDPSDRRFHAQPDACPLCGPQVSLLNREGQRIAQGEDVWGLVRSALKGGKIIAVKGIGGYHLCCDGLNIEAVETLRRRKNRWEKPFAVMIPDLERICFFCRVNQAEEKQLTSPRRPIVLLEKKEGSPPAFEIASGIAPGNRRLGVMLPYTPLHYLLIQGFQVLVMTSGNLSDEPIAYRDQDAYLQLKSMADLFLVHNREIFRRCDDSVLLLNRREVLTFRRSRGYAPEPLPMHRLLPAILACGGEQKNTFCLTRGDQAFLSQHIGDLENLSTLESFEEGIAHFKEMFAIDPAIIAYDLHPDYLATRYALDFPGDLQKIGVQHHHAHLASCLADNGFQGPAIGVIFDGSGYGTDGRIWGGEFLTGDCHDFRRDFHFDYLPMPSGAMAIREPWRMAASYLYAVYGEAMADLPIDFIRRLPGEWTLLCRAMGENTNAPLTSSCGRLFDGVAALIGLRDQVSFQGQAAVELEQIITPGEKGVYPFEIGPGGWVERSGQGRTGWSDGPGGSGKPDGSGEPGNISWQPLIRGLVDDLQEGILPGVMAARFHNTLAAIIRDTCLLMRKANGMDTVALSGGVFQNIYLLNAARDLLLQEGFRVLSHGRVPPNDGGLSLGQAMVAACQDRNLKKE